MLKKNQHNGIRIIIIYLILVFMSLWFLGIKLCKDPDLGGGHLIKHDPSAIKNIFF